MSGDRDEVHGKAGVDVGGTFTDVVVVERGGVRIGKVPTTLDDQGRAVADGIAAVAGGAPVASVAHGTTTATNAVLERDVARTVLVTTRGFADLLTIGRQDRPSLYDLSVVRPPHLVGRRDVVTVHERTAPDGSAVIELSDEEVARVVEDVAARDPEAVALCLLFAYAGPAHEERLAAAIAARIDVPVTCSGALVPEFREYERASTCVLNAAVAPVMRRYLGRLADRLPEVDVTVMTSGGGTVALDVAAEAPVHTLLSGPAAGVVAAAAVARSAGYADAVAFDMGGTSTDVCLVAGGRPDLSAEGEIGGLPFRTPAVAIHTVGAGGGSIAWLDAGGALRVGPRSAGARPGPACYGHGGEEPTVTDAHAVAGHLDAGASLGGGALTLDAGAAEAALGRLGGALGDADAVAEGILTVARATMGRALRRVTTERGVDPRDLALVAYGGAGPLHATALARELGCAAVVVPPAPGVLSALGLLLAPPRAEAARTVMARLTSDGSADELRRTWGDLARAASAELEEQGVADVEVTLVADCRYAGQSHELRIEPTAASADPGGLAEAFHAAHAGSYGYAMADEPVDVVTLRAVAIGRPALDGPPPPPPSPPGAPRGTGDGGLRTRRILLGGARVDAAVAHRPTLTPGTEISGPAIVEQEDATTLLGTDEIGRVDEAGNLVICW